MIRESRSLKGRSVARCPGPGFVKPNSDSISLSTKNTVLSIWILTNLRILVHYFSVISSRLVESILSPSMSPSGLIACERSRLHHQRYSNANDSINT